MKVKETSTNHVIVIISWKAKGFLRGWHWSQLHLPRGIFQLAPVSLEIFPLQYSVLGFVSVRTGDASGVCRIIWETKVCSLLKKAIRVRWR